MSRVSIFVLSRGTAPTHDGMHAAFDRAIDRGVPDPDTANRPPAGYRIADRSKAGSPVGGDRRGAVPHDAA